MKCPGCGAYIPDGLSLKQCIECNASLEGVANVIQRDDKSNIDSPANGIVAEPDLKKQIESKDAAQKIVLAKYPFFAKITVAYGVVAFLLGIVGASSAMRMDPIFGFLTMGPVLIPLWIISMVLSLMLLIALQNFSAELKRNNLIYINPLILVMGQLLSFFIFNPWCSLIIPLWLFALGNGYHSDPGNRKLDDQARMCPKCGASNNKILWNCWKCKHELVARPQALPGGENPPMHRNNSLQTICIYSGIGLMLFGLASIFSLSSGGTRLPMLIFGLIPGALSVLIDESALETVGFVFYTCGFSFWGITGALIGMAFIDKVSVTRKQIILSAVISILVLLWIASLVYLGQKATAFGTALAG